MRDLPTETPVYALTGSYAVTVTAGATIEPYPGMVTLFDLLNAIKTRSNLVDVLGVVVEDKTPEMCIRDRARGDEAEAAREVAKATQEEVQFSQERLEQLRAQRDEVDANIQKLYQQAQADGQVTDAERKVIEALMDKSDALGVSIAHIEKYLPLQEREARQAEIMAGPIGQLIRLYDQKATAAGRETEAVERSYDADVYKRQPPYSSKARFTRETS